MGDMADDALDRLSDFDELEDRYTDPDDAPEWVRELLWDNHGVRTPGIFTKSASSIKSVTCRCCHQSGLQWGLRNGKWRLFDQHDLHHCPVNPLHE